MNGTQPSSCPSNSAAEKVGITFVYCVIFIVSLAGNTVIGIIVYKTQTMRKPINFFIVNMAMSDLLVPVFVIPRFIQRLYIDSWLIGGPLGQALCKLVIFLTRCLHCCVYSELGSDRSGSIWCCGISSPFSSHQFKAVPVLHCHHLGHRDSCQVPLSFRSQTCWISRKTSLWATLEWSFWRLLIL